MSGFSEIVHGGGWKGSSVEMVKFRAWFTLFLAVLFGSLAMVALESLGFYGFVPAGLLLLLSLFYFIREKPRPCVVPKEPADHDPRNF